MAVPPDSRLMVSLIEPVPDGAQVEPADAVHVHVALLNDAGSVSVMVAPVTFEGPAFVATMVYVIVPPATTAAEPSVLVIDRSAVGASVSVSVAELLATDGSVTPVGAAMVAVLASDPVAPAAMFAVSV